MSIYHLPRKYVDMTSIKPAHSVQDGEDGEDGTFIGVVKKVTNSKKRPGLNLTALEMDDGFQGFRAVWFNQKYITKQLTEGKRVIVHGKINIYHNKVSVNVTEYEDITELDDSKIPRVLPVYPLTAGITQNTIRQLVKQVLDDYENIIEDNIPTNIIKRNNLLGRYEALKKIHFPKSLNETKLAQKRIAFEELFILQFNLATRKRLTLDHKKHTYNNDGTLIKKYVKNLSYQLTPGQLKAWKEIRDDMDDKKPMQRLLQGDVGSGKTTVCILAALKATEAGFQTAIMVPTEILALQHYKEMYDYLTPLGVNIALHTSNNKSQSDLDDADIIIGTHALVQKNVQFNNLGLVIIDEQHRFGVNQRTELMSKAQKPDLLVMTATPIPRTLGMIIYGDMDVSIIDTLPPGRMPVTTRRISHQKINKVWTALKGQLQQGRQAYVVCALVEESEKVEQQAATDLYNKLNEIYRGEYKIGLLHGKMKPTEKEAVMSTFSKGDSDILVSTTVIEVGVNVPNATVMIILDADRFGIAQLHQLRGRVGRGNHQSYCLLVAEPRTQEGLARLDAIVKTNDGFKLAEEDLKLRGPGEFFGTRQSGISDLKVANLERDEGLLEAARQEAFNVISKDSYLIRPENEVLIPLFMANKRELQICV